MFSNQVRQRVRGLVAGVGPSIISNPDQLEAKLSDLVATSPDEVRAILAAARGGVAEEIAAAAPEHRADMVEQAANWMASETGLPADISRWAVDIWAKAFGSVGEESVAPPSEKPALTWDDEDSEPAPKQSDLHADTPADDVVPNTAPPRFVPHPIPVRKVDPITMGYESDGLASTRAWKHWIVVGAVIFLLAAGLLCAIALPSFRGSNSGSAHLAQPPGR